MPHNNILLKVPSNRLSKYALPQFGFEQSSPCHMFPNIKGMQGTQHSNISLHIGQRYLKTRAEIWNYGSGLSLHNCSKFVMICNINTYLKEITLLSLPQYLCLQSSLTIQNDTRNTELFVSINVFLVFYNSSK